MTLTENQNRVVVPAPGRLAIAFQEPLTAVVRIRSAQNHEFRTWIERELASSVAQALRDGYSAEDAERANFALIAFLDEAAMYSGNPVFADWISLQGQLYKSEDAGETFFTRLTDIQRRGNTPETADLLEVYVLCLLLGFEGKYGLGRRSLATTRHESLSQLITNVVEQIRRIRQNVGQPQPWRIMPASNISVATDAWVRRLALITVLLIFGVTVLYGAFKVSLAAQLNETVAVLGR